MRPGTPSPTLRALGALGAVALILGTVAPVAAQEGATEPLALTPPQQEGPFYPVEIPADRDSDLTVIEGSEARASGEVLLLEGLLLRPDGSAVEGAVVEIWQTDDRGVYLHPRDPGFPDRDEAFQGFGESITDEDGAWTFRTILPEVYGGRPRHIHAKVKLEDQTLLTTQVYFSGGDIPAEGALEQTGTELDALLVEAFADEDEDGAAILRAQHLLVVP